MSKAKKIDDGIRLTYSKKEEVETVYQLEYRLICAAMTLVELQGCVEITTIAEIPYRGTGSGSFSSFTMGLHHALNAYKGELAL